VHVFLAQLDGGCTSTHVGGGVGDRVGGAAVGSDVGADVGAGVIVTLSHWTTVTVV